MKSILIFRFLPPCLPA